MAADTSTKHQAGPAERRYATGRIIREPYLLRARRLSKLTVGSLFPEDAVAGGDTVIPWQSLGAFLVNNLSAKRTMALFPPGISNIQLKPSKEALQDIEAMDEEDRGKLKAQIAKGLSKVEQEIVDCCEEDGDRAAHFDVARHQIVGGNHCLKILPDDDTLQSISMERYVQWKAPNGTTREAVIEDPLAWDSLPPDIQALCPQEDPANVDSERQRDRVVNVYTHLRLKQGKWYVYQEAFGKTVPGSDWVYDKDALPYLFLGEIHIKGEHWCRSYCEDYEADLTTVDAFWQILTEGSAAIALLKWLVKPGSALNKRAFEKAANGEVLTGDPDDVTAVRAEKGGDLQVAMKMAEMAEARLEKVFLVFSQRQGERVTREEIIRVAQELEATQGGVYSNQVVTYQRPYAQRKMKALQKHGRVTKLPKGSVQVTVLTGDRGLGRAQQSQLLRDFVGTWSELFPELAHQYLSLHNAMIRDGANIGLDTDGLVRSEDDVAAEQQQQQAMALSQQVAPEVVKQGGEMLQLQQQQQAAPQEAGA